MPAMKRTNHDAGRIGLPARYFLSDRGVGYFTNRRVPMNELRNPDGSRCFGFSWAHCDADALEEMVAGALLERIELDRPEFITVRSSLISLTRSILHGALVARFRSDFRRRLVGVPAIAHALTTPTAMTLFSSPALLAEVLDRRRREVGAVRAALAERCAAAVASPGAEDTEEARSACTRLLSAIRGEDVLMMALADEPPFGEAVAAILAYAGRIGVAGQLALLLIEYVQLAEKSYFRSMAEKDRYTRCHPDETQRLLADPEFRQRLIDAGERRGDMMGMRISFGGIAPLGGADECISISFRTKGLMCNEALAEAALRRGDATVKTDLATLLRSAVQDDGYTDTSLAYYAGFRQACAGEGMSFVSDVLLDGMKKETVATMRIAV